MTCEREKPRVSRRLHPGPQLSLRKDAAENATSKVLCGRRRREEEPVSEETVHGERGLYLELSHLPQLQPELGHAPPHVEQARVDCRGAGRRQLAGRP